MLIGSRPTRALRLVREWAGLHRHELAMNWDLAQALEPLVEIDRFRNIEAMLEVTAVKPLDGYRLEIEFNDGVVRVVDCSFLLHGALGEPLKNLDYFRQVRSTMTLGRSSGQSGLDPAPEPAP